MVLGHKDTVLTLLQAGARSSTVNNMGKNVMQLGSFVGEIWGAVKRVISKVAQGVNQSVLSVCRCRLLAQKLPNLEI